MYCTTRIAYQAVTIGIISLLTESESACAHLAVIDLRLDTLKIPNPSTLPKCRRQPHPFPRGFSRIFGIGSSKGMPSGDAGGVVNGRRRVRAYLP